jgi:hypothetical protein
LGVVQIVDGLVALPADARTREQLEWVAEQVTDAAGEAFLWVGRAGSKRQERELAERMMVAVADAYRVVIDDADAARELADGSAKRTLGRLRREMRRIEKRDFFPPREREQARAAIDALVTALVTALVEVDA